LYFKSKYRFTKNGFSLNYELNFHQLFNILENNKIQENQTPFFINPSMGFDWKISDKNKVIASYSYNRANSTIIDIYSDFVLAGFRSFSKGTGGFNQF